VVKQWLNTCASVVVTLNCFTGFTPNWRMLMLLKAVHYLWFKKKTGEYSNGNKTVPGKVATTRTEDGHKQGT